MCHYLQANFEQGSGNPLQKNEQVNYWPSTVEHTDEVESDKATTGRENLGGKRQRSDYGSGKENIIGDDFKQPGDRIRGFSQASRDNLLHHLIAWLTDPKVNPSSCSAFMCSFKCPSLITTVTSCPACSC